MDDAGEVARRFAAAYSQLDDLQRAFPGDGLLIAAVDACGLMAAYLYLAVDEDPAFAIIGAHPRCDLVLGGATGVALRHAALSAHRVGLDDVRIRLWNLQAAPGIRTESGDGCQGVIATGPLFVSLGALVIFCLPTGGLAPVPWGEDAAETWATFPERVAQARLVPPRWAAARGGPGGGTMLVPGPGLLRARAPARPARAPVGWLRMAIGAETAEVAIDDDDLRRGVVIGRDDRCALAARLAGVSREHVLVVEDLGARWAIDTASTNGMTAGGVQIRRMRLDRETELVLGQGVSARWIPAVPP